MRIGLCGLGTVGGGVFDLVTRNSAEIERKVGGSIVIAQVGSRRDRPGIDLSGVKVTRDVFEVARNPEVDVLVELIGGTDTALELVLEAIRHGKHVVTANKALIARHGEEVFAAAQAKDVQVRYEAAVAGGIPIIKAIREGLAANRIAWVAGIINGTTNYILTEMEQPGRNLSFGEVLKDAQSLGYAEADPTFDVEGIDAAHKLAILASVAFGVPLQFAAIYTEGISAITTKDIQYAAELGYKIRHLGITRLTPQGVEMRVHPTLVGRTAMLAQVNGVMNAVMVGSDAANATMYYGPGAGAGPTASSVVADVIDLKRGSQIPNLGFGRLVDLPVLGIQQVTNRFYLRMTALDKPGVMARLTTILSQRDISIEALIQKDGRRDTAEIVILTNDVIEGAMSNCLREIEALDVIQGTVTRLRVSDI